MVAAIASGVDNSASLMDEISTQWRNPANSDSLLDWVGIGDHKPEEPAQPPATLPAPTCRTAPIQPIRNQFQALHASTVRQPGTWIRWRKRGFDRWNPNVEGLLFPPDEGDGGRGTCLDLLHPRFPTKPRGKGNDKSDD